MAKVGFVGLGIMGNPMAGHLIDAGHSACAANGGAAWDHSALVKALEMLANHTVAPDA
jgi:3-hydroxyisobutyrate dehydrogenase-like beta-hydroxyacid dehydrogenase